MFSPPRLTIGGMQGWRPEDCALTPVASPPCSTGTFLGRGEDPIIADIEVGGLLATSACVG